MLALEKWKFKSSEEHPEELVCPKCKETQPLAKFVTLNKDLDTNAENPRWQWNFCKACRDRLRARGYTNNLRAKNLREQRLLVAEQVAKRTGLWEELKNLPDERRQAALLKLAPVVRGRPAMPLVRRMILSLIGLEKKDLKAEQEKLKGKPAPPHSGRGRPARTHEQLEVAVALRRVRLRVYENILSRIDKALEDDHYIEARGSTYFLGEIEKWQWLASKEEVAELKEATLAYREALGSNAIVLFREVPDSMLSSNIMVRAAKRGMTRESTDAWNTWNTLYKDWATNALARANTLLDKYKGKSDAHSIYAYERAATMAELVKFVKDAFARARRIAAKEGIPPMVDELAAGADSETLETYCPWLQLLSEYVNEDRLETIHEQADVRNSVFWVFSQLEDDSYKEVIDKEVGGSGILFLATVAAQYQRANLDELRAGAVKNFFEFSMPATFKRKLAEKVASESAKSASRVELLRNSKGKIDYRVG